MSVTVYAPDARGINGNGRHMADGSRPAMGYAACGYRYKFGTVFEIQHDMAEFGLPNVVECRDRGGMIGPRNLDLVIQTGDVRKDLAIAREWGKRKISVRVFPSMQAYLEHRATLANSGDDAVEAADAGDAIESTGVVSQSVSAQRPVAIGDDWRNAHTQ